MKLALKELLRRPGQFVVVGGALTLLALLMLFLGWLLDGLFLGSTGAIRAQEADAFVFSTEARQSLLRSSVDDSDLQAIAEVEGVATVGGLGVSLLGAEIPGETDVADVAVAGYQVPSATLPLPPPTGTAYGDRHLEDLGASLGDVLLIGPAQVPVELIDWVDDTNYLQQNGVWVDADTWRQVQNANRPDAVVADDEFQVATVVVDGDVDRVIAAIDATLGDTETLSENDTVFAIPGVPEQNTTLTAVIYVTAFVVALVVALFFALLTLERTTIYALLKAVGTPNRVLVAGLVTQATLIAVGAFALGSLIGFGLASVVPPEVPLIVTLGRSAFVLVAVLIAAVIGSVVSFRRVLRIDPASAIGAGV